MIRIEIKSTITGEDTITPTGKPGAKVFEEFTKVSQSAFVHGMVDRNGAPEPFPVRISLTLGSKENHAPAYPVGFYELEPQSYFIDRFDNLSLGKLTLKAMQVQLKAAA